MAVACWKLVEGQSRGFLAEEGGSLLVKAGGGMRLGVGNGCLSHTAIVNLDVCICCMGMSTFDILQIRIY